MMMETAFHAALAPHMKRAPKLKDLLLPDDDAPARRQSWQEMKAALMLIMPPNKKAETDGR